VAYNRTNAVLFYSFNAGTACRQWSVSPPHNPNMAQTIGNLPMNPWGFTNTRLRTHLGVNCSSYISEGQECIYMEVATETTMDLHISKLIPSCHLAWRCYTWSEQAIRPI